jgi:hypothetical protein
VDTTDSTDRTLSLIGWLRSKWLLFWHRATAIFSRLPIVGGLAYCSTANHAAALKEFAVVAGFATATFWLSAFLAQFSVANAATSYPDLVLRTVSRGELFIFSVSILGPVLYTALDEPSWARRGFPEKLLHIGLTVILTLLAATGFSGVKLTPDPNLAFALQSSLTIAAIAIVLRYLTILYNKSRGSSPNTVRVADTKSFVAKAEAHREGAPE